MLDGLLYVSHGHIRMHEKRIKAAIVVIQDEGVNIRAYMPENMKNRAICNPVVH